MFIIINHLPELPTQANSPRDRLDVRINYKKRVKEIDISFKLNNARARYSESEYIFIYIFDIVYGQLINRLYEN